MEEIDKINLFMQYLITKEIVKNQEDFGLSLGYANKSSFSQLLKRKNVTNAFRNKILEAYPEFAEFAVKDRVNPSFLNKKSSQPESQNETDLYKTITDGLFSSDYFKRKMDIYLEEYNQEAKKYVEELKSLVVELGGKVKS